MTTNSQSFNPEELKKQIIDKAQADATYKQRLLSNAKAVFEEKIGEKLAADLEIQALQQSMKKIYLLLPIELDELVRSQVLSEEQLEAVAGGELIPNNSTFPKSAPVPSGITLYI
ncbi:NHLP leader peptide family RiPP precursor [Nostoc sp.]|uniref:NHLP leader peptide family RiPP precursor n=1 Tax=Nostoc sp. TaxID=1180 RepID=UPI002FF7B0E7